MLRRLDRLKGFAISATDEEIGSVGDFYFEDDTWYVRYVIVDTGPWILGKQVLISPVAVNSIDWQTRTVHVDLTKEQVENSPGIDVDEPVSRQHEIDLYAYYGWPAYWYGAPGMAAPTIPVAAATPAEETASGDTQPGGAGQGRDRGDPHLRSVDEVLGYDIQATDDNIGHVEDFLVDEADWRIRYLLVDTRNWLPGRTVLIAIDWIEDIDWAARDMSVKVTREQVANSPEYDPEQPVPRHMEEALFDYYQLPRYWY